MTRNCEECGKEFEAKVAAQRYCCQKCRDIRYARIRGTGVEKTLTCEWCGKQFQSARKKKYCSKQCRSSFNSSIPDYIDVVPKRKKTKSKKENSLAKINALAKQAGLSYGQYVALNRI